jgi:hypothetical protein
MMLVAGDDRDEDCNNKERERGRRGRRGDGERRGRARGERGQRRVPGERRGRGERRRIPDSGKRAFIGAPTRTTSTTSTEAPIVIPHTIIVQVLNCMLHVSLNMKPYILCSVDFNCEYKGTFKAFKLLNKMVAFDQ